MAHTPARVMRKHLLDRGIITRPEHDQQRAYEIMGVAIKIFARHGLYGIPLTRFANELGISTQKLRYHFCDLEHLLGEILRTYVNELIYDLSEIPAGAVNRPALCRAAYARMLRDIDGKLTPLHDLLVRLAPQLPPDEQASLDTNLKLLHALLGPGIVGATAASLLDKTRIPLERLEVMLIVLMQGEQQVPRAPLAANQNTPGPQKTLGTEPCRPTTRPPGSSLH